MPDLITKLRDLANQRHRDRGHDAVDDALREAADEIERMRSEQCHIDYLAHRLMQQIHGRVVHPVAWVIPGDDDARSDGFIDAMAWSEGEFTQPLYLIPPAAEVRTDANAKRSMEAFALMREKLKRERAVKAKAGGGDDEAK